MANNTDDTPWYQSMWSWFGDTASNIYTAKLQSDQAKYEADLIAQQQWQNKQDTIEFLGHPIHKNTLLWIAGGSLLATLILVIVRKK